MKFVANKLLWRFVDAVVPLPSAWKSKQAKRLYDAAMEKERSGDWSKTAVTGSVRAATHKTTIPAIADPSFGYRTPDEAITAMMERHIADLRQQADRLENVMRAYGPSAFRTGVVALHAPIHPFDAEAALLSVINGGHDEIWVHGVHFVRDESRAFVRAERCRNQPMERAMKIWQNANGTWSHHRDARREWADRDGCATDLRFHEEWVRHV